MDVNKAEHATADTNGRQERIPNGALAHAGARRRKHAVLGVTGGPPAKKRNGRRSGRRHPVKHPGRKPSNKRRDRRVNRRERRAINARYANQKMFDKWDQTTSEVRNSRTTWGDMTERRFQRVEGEIDMIKEKIGL